MGANTSGGFCHFMLGGLPFVNVRFVLFFSFLVCCLCFLGRVALTLRQIKDAKLNECLSDGELLGAIQGAATRLLHEKSPVPPLG